MRFFNFPQIILRVLFIKHILSLILHSLSIFISFFPSFDYEERHEKGCEEQTNSIKKKCPICIVSFVHLHINISTLKIAQLPRAVDIDAEAGIDAEASRIFRLWRFSLRLALRNASKVEATWWTVRHQTWRSPVSVDHISAEGQNSPNEAPEMIGAPANAEHSFIAIATRSTLARSDSTW